MSYCWSVLSHFFVLFVLLGCRRRFERCGGQYRLIAEENCSGEVIVLRISVISGRTGFRCNYRGLVQSNRALWRRWDVESLCKR